MLSRWVLRIILGIGLMLSFCSGQSGDELLEIGSGSTIDEMRDSAQQFKNEAYGPDHCELTFHTQPHHEPCRGVEEPSASKQELQYLKDLLKDTARVLQNLQYTVRTEAGDLSYQEEIMETIRGTKEDNQEFHVTFNKVFSEFQSQMEDDSVDTGEEKKKLKKDFVMMDHMLRMNRRLAEQLDTTSHDLDVLLTQHFKKSMSLLHRSTVKS
ncbi:hypothetical protein NDU88_010898 [Pleurodeles waltl]|uniref:Uncharacterized protein n=2 Tax=Pleurodeles waltl TaxID=8319 RepID=A0AAV7RZJ1_PLEWA|nr:hypothetical protein NDU88_010898 [Pleurodeles waltl]